MLCIVLGLISIYSNPQIKMRSSWLTFYTTELQMNTPQPHLNLSAEHELFTVHQNNALLYITNLICQVFQSGYWPVHKTTPDLLSLYNWSHRLQLTLWKAAFVMFEVIGRNICRHVKHWPPCITSVSFLRIWSYAKHNFWVNALWSLARLKTGHAVPETTIQRLVTPQLPA